MRGGRKHICNNNKNCKTCSHREKLLDDDANMLWVKTRWRPAMAWLYVLICAADFLIFPAAYTSIQYNTATSLIQWIPLTLQGGGFFHIAMGAILGITAYSRGKEKMLAMSRGYHLDTMVEIEEHETLDPTYAGGEDSGDQNDETR